MKNTSSDIRKNLNGLCGQKFSLIASLMSILILNFSAQISAQDKEVDLTIEIIQQGSNESPAAWTRVQIEGNDNLYGWYGGRGLKGFPAYSPIKIKVPTGKVTISAWNNVCDEVIVELQVTHDEPAVCKLILTPRLDMHKMGYFSFDAHDHMDGESEKNCPPYIYPYCEAMGIDHLGVCQLWFHELEKPVSYDSIINYLDAYSTPKLNLKFGAESPKLRYGHTWTINHPGMTDPMGDYIKRHDADYYEFRDGEVDGKKYNSLDLRGEFHPKWNPPFVDRLRNRAKGAFSAGAHPTSWWHQGEDEIYPATNLLADLAFDLLVAQSYDGIVVMGYSKDNLFYQNLWFNLLNLGYRLTPVAESDGDVAKGNLGNTALTYAWTGKNKFDINSLTSSLKKGRTTLSGKAIMLLDVDGTLPPGTVLEANGENHSINVEVYSEPEIDEYISYLVLFRNGEIIEKLDFREQKKRFVKHTFIVNEVETAWYVVKSFGKEYPQEDLQFDVMAYAEKCLTDSNDDYIHHTGVSMTAPVYFNAPGWRAPETVISSIHGTLLDDEGKLLKNTAIEIWNIDERLAVLKTDSQGRFMVNAPATIDVRFTLPNGRKEQQWLFYEYPPLLNIMEEIYTISWAKKYPGLQRSQMPWEAFQYNEIRDVLKEIHWTIKPNGKTMFSDSK